MTVAVNSREVSILIVDDHIAVAGMIAAVVGTLPGMKVMDCAADAESALRCCRREKPDVIVLDFVLPTTGGLTLLRALRELCPQAAVLIFTGHLTAVALQGVLASGATGVVEKMAPLEDFRTALQAVASGQTYFGPLAARLIQRSLHERGGSGGFTPREEAVLTQIARGLSSKEIADRLGVSLHTVINDRSRLMEKTGLRRVAQLSLYAMRAGLLGESQT